jgi:PTS system cellobiose-specific IIC component
MGKLYETKFMTGLQKFGATIAGNEAISSISAGLQSGMSVIIIGAIFQLIATIFTLFNWITTDNKVYSILMTPYNMTMGLLAVFVAFGIAYHYAGNLKMKPLVAGINSLVVFLLVAAPTETVTLADGSSTFTGLATTSLGASGLFAAIIVALVTVRITKFCADKRIIIRMPDGIPPSLADSFSALIPLLINIILFLGLSIISNALFSASLPLAITNLLSAPFSAINSLGGMIVIVLFGLLLWTLGIHGTMVIAIPLIPILAADIANNTALVAAGSEPIFTPVMLFYTICCAGGSGNTFGFTLLCLRSKSKQLKAVGKAALLPGIVNISEPIVFGTPIIYNPIIAIPFIITPIITMIIGWIGFSVGILKPMQAFVLSTLPIGVMDFMTTLSWTNVVFAFLVIPLTMLCYLPFFKIYEKQLIAKEKIIEQEEAVMGQASLNNA